MGFAIAAKVGTGEIRMTKFEWLQYFCKRSEILIFLKKPAVFARLFQPVRGHPKKLKLIGGKRTGKVAGHCRATNVICITVMQTGHAWGNCPRVCLILFINFI